MEDVRPELELEPTPQTEPMTDAKKAQLEFSRLAHDIGTLQFQIKTMQADFEDLFIKMRNAHLDYVKAKKAETRAHIAEATPPEGVTQ